MNWFLWAAVAAAAAGIVLFTALWIDVSRGPYRRPARSSRGDLVGLVCWRRDRTRHHRSRRKVLVTPYAKERGTEAPKKPAKD
jgi:hypothetical protein